MPLWWNWYTRQVKDLCLNWRAGSSPVGGILPIFSSPYNTDKVESIPK